ncbi:MAG: type IV secretory system conjugative DNA transfer family protein, partial [Candidatus Limnocylindria bacterium]
MKKPLYQLPGYGRMTFRQEAVRGLFLGLVAVAVWSAGHTQLVAHHFGYPPQFGEPLFAAPGAWFPWLIVGAGTAALGAACILFWAENKPQAGFFVLVALLFALAAAAPVYQPFGWIAWTRGWGRLPEWRTWHAGLHLSFWTGAAVIVIGYLVFLALQARRLRERGHTHGSAEWAKRKDVERAGLLADSGIILGLWEEPRRAPRYLRSSGTHSVFVQGPPRSGKGVGIVVPTLLTWPGAAIVHDAKGELWGLTAGYRAAPDGLANRCLRFDPTNAADGSARYNPLLEVRPGPEEVGDIQNIAGLLADPHGQVRVSSASEEYFRTNARRLIGATILHVLYAEPDKTLGRVTSLLSGTGGSFVDALNRMAGTVHLPLPDDGDLLEMIPADVRVELTSGEPRTHPHVFEVASAMAATDYRTLSGIQSTALAALDIYQDPLVRRNTRTSDFRVRDLMHAERPVTLYLTVPAADVDRARPLVRLLLAQALRTLMHDLDVVGGRAAPTARHQL